MGHELAYLGLAAAMGSYAVLTILDTYQASRHGKHFWSFHQALDPFVALVLLLPTLIYYRKYQYVVGMRRNNCSAATLYPHRDPIGLDWFITVVKGVKNYTLLENFQAAFDKCGATYWGMTLGEWIIVSNEPENIKSVHMTNFDAWPTSGPRQQVTEMTLGPHAIFAVNGREWQEARATIRPSFVRDQIADLQCFGKHVSNLIARIPRTGDAINLQTFFFMMTMDSSTDFMFGKSTDMLSSPTKESLDFAKAFDYSMVGAAYKARIGWIGSFLPDRQLTWSIKTIHEFADKYVQMALNNRKRPKERRYVFLDEIVQTGASPDVIRGQVLSIILGGRDTTASVLSALFWHLARRPDVQKKLRKEIDELNGQEPTWEGLKGMKYMNMCIKEILRMYPPVATNSRKAARDTVLPVGGGPEGKDPVFVPKGYTFRWISYTMHRRQDFYGEDTEEFRPERWEDLRLSWEYIPFGGGPRICIGQQFALTQMLYTTTRIFQEFEKVEARDTGKPLLKFGGTISLVNGCLVSFTPR